MRDMLCALEYFAKDRVADALPMLLALHQSQRDLSGMKRVALLYNIGCCQHRLGQTEDCMKSIEDAVDTLSIQLDVHYDIKILKVLLKDTL